MIMSAVAMFAADELPEYSIVGAGTGAQGTYLVEVSALVSKADKADETVLARCAVHGVLFKGFAGKDSRQSQKPMAGGPAAEASHADYYSNFFKKDGPAADYASVVSPSVRRVKSGKKYRVTATVSVNKEQLSKDLEAAGVLRGLNSIF